MPCGIDLDFTALKDKLSALKDSAMAEINSTVAAAGAAAQAKMDAFESTIRGWVDELPDLPDSPFTCFSGNANATRSFSIISSRSRH